MLDTMNHESITGQLVVLGSGTSHGVPVIGCDCAICRSTNPKDRRDRCSVAWGLPDGNLLIDTPPEMRLQLLREKISVIDAVAITHAHADHLFGFDDIRIFPHFTGANVPIHCTEHVQRSIRQTFSYAFDPVVQNFPAGGVPRVTFQTIDDQPFELLGAEVVPIRTQHGQCECTGFRIGDIAYCTDCKTISPEGLQRLAGVRVLLLGCIRLEPHISHMNLEEALKLVDHLKPEMTYLTHISHRLGHDALCSQLPAHVRPAWDGLRISMLSEQ